jgi:outer membrane immunogenic protein
VFEPNHYKVDSSGSVRARAGLVILPTTLIYATGGLALAKFQFSEHDGPTATTSVMTGWTAGGGIDQALTRNLIVRVEYFYADYGSRNFSVSSGDDYSIGFKSQMLRGALMWKF